MDSVPGRGYFAILRP